MPFLLPNQQRQSTEGKSINGIKKYLQTEKLPTSVTASQAVWLKQVAVLQPPVGSAEVH